MVIIIEKAKSILRAFGGALHNAVYIKTGIFYKNLDLDPGSLEIESFVEYSIYALYTYASDMLH